MLRDRTSDPACRNLAFAGQSNSGAKPRETQGQS
jgi:hypothetical protein